MDILRMLVAAAGLLFLMSACMAEPERTTFETMDYPRRVTQMKTPTGLILHHQGIADKVGEQLSVNVKKRFLKDYLKFYRQVEKILDYLAKTTPADSTYVAPPTEGELNASEPFIDYSCMGADVKNPATDFSAGTIHIEGPSFSIQDVIESGEISLQGHFYAEFADCDFWDIRLDGSASGYIDDVNDRIGWENSLTFEYLDLEARISVAVDSEVEAHVGDDLDISWNDNWEEDIETYVVTASEQVIDTTLRNRVIILAQDVVWILIETPVGAYALGLVPSMGEERFIIAAGNGNFECHVETDDSWQCASPLVTPLLQQRLDELQRWD